MEWNKRIDHTLPGRLFCILLFTVVHTLTRSWLSKDKRRLPCEERHPPDSAYKIKYKRQGLRNWIRSRTEENKKVSVLYKHDVIVANAIQNLDADKKDWLKSQAKLSFPSLGWWSCTVLSLTKHRTNLKWWTQKRRRISGRWNKNLSSFVCSEAQRVTFCPLDVSGFALTIRYTCVEPVIRLQTRELFPVFMCTRQPPLFVLRVFM